MTATAPQVLDTARFDLLDRIVARLRDGEVDDATRRAVSLLTAVADPDRARRLAVRPGEPTVLVERLAVWALRRVDDETVTAAADLLAASPPHEVEDRYTASAPAPRVRAAACSGLEAEPAR